jgi:GTPase
MINIKEEEQQKTRCLLVGEPGNELSELKGLVSTLGMETVQTLTLSRLEPTPAYGMGKGKAAEIAALAKDIQADCIIFDFNIEPTKQRNWEELVSLPVFDRQEVILRIFAQRAQTREASLQVELARLVYSLPRLAHMYGNMSRQRGGNYGAKGSGETQLELDQREIREKIQQLRDELKRVAVNRETQRKKRDKILLPTCALVGYTNAGKSSLLNALTKADVFVEDKLFATLDPTTRQLSFKEGNGILLTDTVGFISNLPHSLVDAFKSTLEEAARAQLLLIVIDAADPDAEKQYSTVQSVLHEIGADKTRQIIVLNKIDKLNDISTSFGKLDTLFPEAVRVSAKTKQGFEHLTECISKELFGEKVDLVIPVSESRRLDIIRKTGIIYSEEWLEDGIHVTARIHP